jgi:hypothetical protein
MRGDSGGVFVEHPKGEYCLDSVVPGGGKCPEEEHTTCSGGPTINCHKRGLRGERKFYFIKIK